MMATVLRSNIRGFTRLFLFLLRLFLTLSSKEIPWYRIFFSKAAKNPVFFPFYPVLPFSGDLPYSPGFTGFIPQMFASFLRAGPLDLNNVLIK